MKWKQKALTQNMKHMYITTRMSEIKHNSNKAKK